MFKVLNKDLKVITVYGVRNPFDRYHTEFLVYTGGVWHWVDANNYKPVTNTREEI